MKLIEEVEEVIRRRQKQYGDPFVFFRELAQAWSVTLGKKITAAEVIVCFIDFKLSKLKKNHFNHNTMLDIVGYTVLLSDITESEKSN